MGWEKGLFLNPPGPQMLCAVCEDVLDTPMHTPCDHYFCSHCIQAHLDGGGRGGRGEGSCPECDAPLQASQLRPASQLVQNMVKQLAVRCPHTSRGCQQPDLRLGALSEHLAQCGFAPVHCPHPGCPHHGDDAPPLSRSALPAHVAQCGFSGRAACALGCGQGVAPDRLEAHRRECPKRPVTCGRCHQKVAFDEQGAHAKESCAQGDGKCDVDGCGFSLRRSDEAGWERHHREQAHHHLTLFMRKLKVQERLIAQNDGKISEQAQQLAEHERELGALKRAAQSSNQQQQQKQQHHPSPHNAPSLFAASAMWTLTDFATKRSMNRKFTSHDLSFASCAAPEHRYWFRLIFDPCVPDGSFGLFFVPLRGPDHKVLEWPIKRNITLRVLNVGGGQHYQRTMDVLGDPAVRGFLASHAPPAENNTVGHGYPKFLPPNLAQTGQFVQSNDLMFIEVLLG